MASNGLQYFTTYLQSHEERYAKFRDEAYQELVLQKQMEDEYRKALREREKVLQDAINKARKGEEEGINKLELIKEERALNQAIIASQNEGRDSRLKIREGLQDQLTVPQAAQTKLADAANTLATSGGLIVDPAGVKSLIEGQVNDVAASIKGGTRSAASTAQQLWKQLQTDKSWARLSAADIDALEQSITAKFGLDTVNIGGVSGDALLDTPQDVLLQKEEDALLAQEGGAYGVSALRRLLAELEALKKEGSQAAIDAKQAEIDAALGPEKAELDKIRRELSKEPVPFQPAEADVRKRAAEKYGFEAPAFMKQQFARDVLGTDKNKLLHYDAIQAAKSSPISKESDTYKQALMLSQNRKMLGETKAQQRQNIIDMAVKFAGDDIDLRDEFLIAYHQILMNEDRAKYEPSEVLPEPERMADIEDVLSPRGLTGVDPEARLAEAERDFNLQQRIADKMVALTNEQIRLEQSQAVVNDKDPAIAERLLRIKDDKERLVALSREAEKTGRFVKDTTVGRSEMTDAALSAAATERDKALFPEPRPKSPVAIKPSADTALKRLQQQLTIEDLFKSDI
jgi:hypothetical protein